MVVFRKRALGEDEKLGGAREAMHSGRNGLDFSYSPKGVDQSLPAVEEAKPLYFSLDLNFCKKCEEKLTPSVALDNPANEGLNLARRDQLIRLVCDFVNLDSFEGKLRADALTPLIVAAILRNLQAADPNAAKHNIAPHKMRLITSYIDAHSDQQIRIDTLAALADISKFHFARMFKQETGLSPYQYVLRHRIRKLRGLLMDSRKSLAELAFEVGFSSQSHMSETFRKVVGISPGKYRKEICSWMPVSYVKNI